MNPQRRCLVFAASAAALVAGCGTSPPAHWYQLPIDPPEAAPAAPASGAAVWALSGRIAMPGALDRDTLVRLDGAEVQTLTGHRWAEPLRDSVPRLLRHDLERLRGRGSVWLAPAPAGTAATPLRVELLALQADAARGQLRLLARWWLADGTAPARAFDADLSVPVNGNEPAALVAAYRLALWRLATRIAASG